MSIRVGFLGAGFISGVHRRNLSADPRVAVTAVHDVDAGRAGDLYVDSVDKLIDSVDVVYVTSPNTTHAEYAVKAAKAGKHVFCEKPMSVTLMDALRVHEAAEASGAVFQVGHNRRFAPVYQRVRELLQGTPPHCAHIKMNRGELLNPAWTGDESVTGGFLFETPIHMFDMMRFQFGEMVSLEARESRKDDFSLLIEFASGLHSTFTTSADASWFFPYESMEVYCEYGTIRTAEMESVDYRFGLENPTSVEHFANLSIEEKWGFAEGDRLFIDAVEKNGKPAVSSLDGLRSVEIALAVYESAREKRRVEL